MKIVLRFSFFVLTLFHSFDSFAQDRRLNLGLRVGVSYSDLTTENGEIDNFYKPRYNPTFSLDADYQFSKLFSLSSGISFRQKGFTSEIDLTDVNGNLLEDNNEFFEHTYLTVPLRIGLFFGDKIRFSLGVGPYLGIRIKSVYDTDVKVEGQSFPMNVSNQYKSIDYGLSSRIGIAFSIKERLSVSLSLTDELGFYDISDFDYWGNVKTHLIAGEVGVGMNF